MQFEFEFGFYTPGTQRAREVEGRVHKRRVTKQTKKAEPEPPRQPEVGSRQMNKLVIVRKSEALRPRVTLPRKDGIVLSSASVYISSPVDVSDRIETRKREIILRERLSDHKTPESQYWTQALAASIDASSACL